MKKWTYFFMIFLFSKLFLKRCNDICLEFAFRWLGQGSLLLFLWQIFIVWMCNFSLIFLGSLFTIENITNFIKYFFQGMMAMKSTISKHCSVWWVHIYSSNVNLPVAQWDGRCLLTYKLYLHSRIVKMLTFKESKTELLSDLHEINIINIDC